MNARIFLRTGACALLLGSALVARRASIEAPASGSPDHPASTLVIDAGRALETDYLGNGVQWAAYPMKDLSERSWQRLFRRAEFMRLQLVRIMVPACEYTDSFPPGGTPHHAYDSERLKRVYRVLDFCEAHGIDVILGDWDSPQGQCASRLHAAGSAGNLHADGIDETDPRWTLLVADFLRHLLDVKKYTCVKFVTLGNEPNGAWMHFQSFESWRTAILGLRHELVGRGMGDRIGIVGPDTVWANEWIRKVVDDPELAAAIAAYEVHAYATSDEIESGAYGREMDFWRNYISQNDPAGRSKRFFMGEAGMLTGKDDVLDVQTRIASFDYGVWMADFVVQSMRAGQAGLIAWSMDDAMYSSDGLGSDVDVRSVHWKRWGFWDSLGEEKGEGWQTEPRPWFFVWSLLSRYVPRGSRVLRTGDSGVPGLRGSAATFTEAGRARYTFVVVNEVDEARRVRLVLTGANGAELGLRQYDYFADDMLRDDDGLPMVRHVIDHADLAAGVTVDLPGKGVILLTSADG